VGLGPVHPQRLLALYSRFELQTLPLVEIQQRVAGFKDLVALGGQLEATRQAARELKTWRGSSGHPRALLRREQAALKLKLPTKHIHTIDVEPSEAELRHYNVVFSDTVPQVSTTADGPLRPRQLGDK
jgi:hypothetical protein